MLGSCVVRPTHTVPGYMEWYFKMSHPYIIPIPEGYSMWPIQTDVVV
jgi:hypothetical protein